MANISNSSDNTILNGTSSADTIVNSGEYVQIYGGAGNDSIDGSGGAVLVGISLYAEAGNDTIEGGYIYSTINAGTGADFLNLNYVGYSTITGGEGNDTIGTSQIINSIIMGGAGNDWMLVIGGSSNVIMGDEGDDIIANFPESLNSAFGDYQGNYYVYATGDGNDTIIGFNELDTLAIIDGTYSTVVSGSNLIVNVGDKTIVLRDAAGMDVYIDGTYDEGGGGGSTATTGDDYLTNDKDGATIDALAGNDTIENYGENVSINGGAGNDLIYSSNGDYSGANVTIDGGAGNDTIVGLFGDSSVYGGAGNDLIQIDGDVDYATINGGSGNDTIFNDGADGRNVFHYEAGGGDDVIYDFTENDTLVIDGDTYTTLKSGNDLIVKVGSGSVTLKDAAYLEVYIEGEFEGGDGIIENSSDGVAVQGTADDDTIYSSGSSVTINAGAGNDSVSLTSADDAIYYNLVQGGDGADTIMADLPLYSTINGGRGDDIIRTSYGIENLINGGDGANTIFAQYSFNSSINGGDDGDIILVIGYGNTIRGGKGNDTIANSVDEYSEIADDFGEYTGNVYLYQNGDGNTEISGYDGRDTLKISGSTYSTQISGSDLI